MLSFFRNFTKSRIGLIVVFVFLGVIALAFAGMDVMGTRTVGSTGSGTVVARVGGRTITEAELRDRIQIAADNARRNGQNFSMQEFIEGGGLDYALQQTIDNAALEAFAREHGMRVSKRTIDGMIASNPAFQGPAGGFDQQLFETLLARERISETALREDLRASKYVSWLVDPTLGASQVPTGMALPYASLLLERRRGEIAYIPTLDMNPGSPPNAQQLQQYYQRNIGRYTVPERRVVRYAVLNADSVRVAPPTDAEIQQAYRASGERFAARETRSVQQLVLGDRAAAQRVAQAVRGGRSLAQAASAEGLEVRSFEEVTKSGLASETSQAVADAAFAAESGAIAGPVQSDLGWEVLRVDSVQQVPARSLAEAREELTAELRERKRVEAIVNSYNSLDEGIGDGATFDELVANAGIEAQRTPALLADGRNPEDREFQLDETLRPVLQAGFAAEQGGEPQLVPLGTEQFALVSVERVVPAAPRPLDAIREGVQRDYLIDRAHERAREVAIRVVRAVNNGTPLRQALAAAGVTNAPPIQNIDASRAELAATRQQLPPPVQLMFTMAEGRARQLEADNREGYYVVHLEEIESRDASGNEQAIQTTQNGIASVIGRELAGSFVDAIRRDLGVTRNEEALARLRESLLRSGSAGN